MTEEMAWGQKSGRSTFDILIEYHPKKGRVSMATVVIEGQYQTIIIDPPWPIEKVERIERPIHGQQTATLMAYGEHLIYSQGCAE